MKTHNRTRLRLQILWACAAINAVAAKIAWGSTMGGINLGIAVATTVMALWIWLETWIDGDTGDADDDRPND